MSKDAAENRLEEYDDVFADIFDNLILGGRGIVKAEDLISRPTRAYMRKTDGEIRSGMRDIRKENRRNEQFRLICGMENQTEIDNTMPERLMGYEYAGYEEQVKQIMDENKARKRSAGAKRIFGKQKLAPVLTGVLYYGEREWKKPRCLHDLLQFPEGMEDVPKEYVADYPMNLVQVARLTKEERERLTSDFRIVAEYLACKDDRKKWEEFLKNTKEIRHVEELLDVIWELSGDEHYYILKDKIRNEKKRKEKWNMCQIAEELERIGIEKGIQQGIQRGMQKGIKKGMKSGIETGIVAMIRENLDMGLQKETILEKIVRYFSVTHEKALRYYNQVVME